MTKSEHKLHKALKEIGLRQARNEAFQLLKRMVSEVSKINTDGLHAGPNRYVNGIMHSYLDNALLYKDFQHNKDFQHINRLTALLSGGTRGAKVRLSHALKSYASKVINTSDKGKRALFNEIVDKNLMPSVAPRLATAAVFAMAGAGLSVGAKHTEETHAHPT